MSVNLVLTVNLQLELGSFNGSKAIVKNVVKYIYMDVTKIYASHVVQPYRSYVSSHQWQQFSARYQKREEWVFRGFEAEKKKLRYILHRITEVG